MNQTPGAISEAFSRLAEKHDQIGENNPHQMRIRGKVYAHLRRHLPQGGRILELNAGTGTDAIQLARMGYTIHATDIASGMIAQLKRKVAELNMENQITHQLCSFETLEDIQGGPYDAVFSNMGGLNCISDLGSVIRGLPVVLRIGGVITWVLMSSICLWELAEAFRGRFRLAFRRLARNGAMAHLEGLTFKVYYFNPRQVMNWFGTDYRLLSIEGLSVLTPTADSSGLIRRHRAVYQLLSRFDDWICMRLPFRNLGDFFIISVRYQPE